MNYATPGILQSPEPPTRGTLKYYGCLIRTLETAGVSGRAVLRQHPPRNPHDVASFGAKAGPEADTRVKPPLFLSASVSNSSWILVCPFLNSASSLPSSTLPVGKL